MKNLGCLVRQGGAKSERKNFGNVNMVRRKDMRRIKRINYYNKEISGQQNPNTWFTPKKLKAMGNHIESIRNNHIGTNPVPQDIQKQMLKVFPKMSDYQYWRYRNFKQQLLEEKQRINQCDLDFMISQMPAKIRNTVHQSPQQQMPEILKPLLKYGQQLQVFLPLDERHRYNLQAKLQHPPKAKLEGEDD